MKLPPISGGHFQTFWDVVIHPPPPYLHWDPTWRKSLQDLDMGGEDGGTRGEL